MTSLNIRFVHIAIVDMMVLFNAAVNPFVYTLMSHQFRQKQGSDLLPKCFCSTQAKAAKENKGIETRL